MDSKNVIGYYDNFIAEQLESGINDRIYHLYKRLLGLGLKSNSNVLELGSGIGTMTFLLAKYVKEGKIEAVDLSPRSIEFSSQRIKSPNISFVAADIVSYQPAIQNIDFITLFDIIEHIPIDKHNDLFHNMAVNSKEQTKILINIPNPACTEHDQQNNPEALQIIDQPIPLSLILKNLETNGLTLTYFETYSIWLENDYQFLVIEKKKAFKEVKLSSQRNLFQKALKKLERTYVKFRYNYR
jgi:cyclopropane fatty-acyl-phospholipid synthase-like methyltransferase